MIGPIDVWTWTTGAGPPPVVGGDALSQRYRLRRRGLYVVLLSSLAAWLRGLA